MMKWMKKLLRRKPKETLIARTILPPGQTEVYCIRAYSEPSEYTSQAFPENMDFIPHPDRAYIIELRELEQR